MDSSFDKYKCTLLNVGLWLLMSTALTCKFRSSKPN